MTRVQEGNTVILNATIRSNPLATVSCRTPSGQLIQNGNGHYDLRTITIGNEDNVRGTTVEIQLTINNVSGSRDNGQFICYAAKNFADVVNTVYIYFQIQIECKSLIIKFFQYQYLISICTNFQMSLYIHTETSFCSGQALLLHFPVDMFSAVTLNVPFWANSVCSFGKTQSPIHNLV